MSLGRTTGEANEFYSEVVELDIDADQIVLSNPASLPVMARRLLQLRYGDLTGLLDDTWAGFAFHHGELFHPLFKYGFSADEVRGWFFGRQELAEIKRQNARLSDELRALRMSVWANDKLRGLHLPAITTQLCPYVRWLDFVPPP